MKRRILLMMLAAIIALHALSRIAPHRCVAADSTDAIVTVSGIKLIDGEGKPLLLHGINVVNKSQAEGYTKNIEQADLATIRSWGMNCIRLGILWDGLEPQPGRINEEYLNRIARIIG